MVKVRDFKQLLRGTLIGIDALTAIVDDRIYGAHIQDSDIESAVYPMVVFEALGGNARWHGAVQSVSFEVYAYSKVSSDQASEIYDLIYEQIQHSCLSLTGVTNNALSKEVQRPVDGWNPAARAWFVRGRWLLSGTG